MADDRKDPSFDKPFREARAQIDATDKIIRALDAARIDSNISKADLARRIGAAPETLRRLFTAKGQNPTADMLTRLADALGCEFRVVSKKRSLAGKPRSRAVASKHA